MGETPRSKKSWYADPSEQTPDQESHRAESPWHDSWINVAGRFETNRLMRTSEIINTLCSNSSKYKKEERLRESNPV